MKKLNQLKKIDFTNIINKLNDSEEGEGWDLLKCLEIKQEYLKFLYLIFVYPKSSLIPSKEVDIFWHYHILDTKKYMHDCYSIFGKYIHHTPSYTSSLTINQTMIKRIEFTKLKYNELFGIESFMQFGDCVSENPCSSCSSDDN